MNNYLRIFLITFLSFCALFGSALYAFDQHYVSDPEKVDEDVIVVEENIIEPVIVVDNAEEEEVAEEEVVEAKTELEILIEDSNRINILAVGLEDYRTDTLMVLSYNRENHKLDVVSVPRDTYNYMDGYDESGQKKINAVYGTKTVGGITGLKREISEITGIPIDNYVIVDYDAVEAVVDVLGGYSIEIPYDMVYDDIYDEPPLHINILQGQQTLSGEDTMKYLRFRQNNDGTIKEGDIQRIERQQAFLETMIKKTLSLQLGTVINTVINYVQTDVQIGDAMVLATTAIGMSLEDVEMYTLPGEAGYSNGTSYYFHDPAETEKLMIEIYNK